jgi:hypothetical protein
MRAAGGTLMAIRDQLRGQGFVISHQSVKNIIERREAAASRLSGQQLAYKAPYNPSTEMRSSPTAA